MKSCLFVALLATATALVAADAPKILPKEAAKLVADGKAVLVDIREPGEWAESGVAAPAVLLPKSDFDGDQKQWKEFLANNEGKQVIVYCRSGTRCQIVGDALAAKGVKVANAGGFKGWVEAGLPTRKADVKPENKSAQPQK